MEVTKNLNRKSLAYFQAAYLEHKRRQKNKESSVIPIVQLAAEHLNGGEGEMKVLAQAVCALLTAYTYRMCQVAEMLQQFPEEVDQVKTSRFGGFNFCARHMAESLVVHVRL